MTLSLTALARRSAGTLLLAPLAILAPLAFAQPNPSAGTPPRTAAAGDAVQLSPFEVNSTGETGYGANRSTSVTLLNQDTALLPVTSEVMTAAFLRDLNLNGDMAALVENFGMSAGFASNQNADSAFGSEPGSRQANAEIKLRGLGTGGIRRDGMVALTGTSSADSFSTERIEILRGPNALLYSDAGGGGVITAVSKQARFGERASLSFSARTDSFGSLRGEADFNQSFSTTRSWMPRIAVRGAAFMAETHYWRDYVFRKSNGSYLQVAAQLPRNTVARVWYERTAEDNYAGITPGFSYTASHVGTGWVPPAEVVARHIGYNNATPTFGLRDLLGETTASGANAAATILNGRLNWQNIGSWFVQKEWTPRAQILGTSVETRWSRAFSTIVKYMYRDEDRDMDYNRSVTLYPAGYRITDINSATVTTDDWTGVVQAPRLYNVMQRNHSFRAAGALEFTLWNGRMRNTLVPGVDYAASVQREWYVDFYEADANWNLLKTTSAQNLYRFPMPNSILFNAANPVKYFRPESDVTRFTYGGRNWVAQETSPEFYVAATPDNPWGLPTNAITTNRGNWGRYFKWFRGAFATLYTDWLDGRYTTMFSLRNDRSFKRQFTAAKLDPLEVAADKISYNAGVTARIRGPLRAFLNYSKAQTPAVNMFPDPLGQPLKDAENTGVEYGLKTSLLNERLHVSASAYHTEAKNEFLNTGIAGSINPSGLNGSVAGRGTWSNINRKSDGYELSIDGSPRRGWMMRLTAAEQGGRTGTDLVYPIYYNDEFNTDGRGGVTWSDGSPYMVKVNPADTAANAPLQQLTLAMLNNGDAKGNYRAILNPVNGAITNRGDVFPTTTDKVHGTVGTGRTGLPASANQLQWDDPLGYNGMYIASRAGTRSLGVPRYTVSLTNSYDFSSGPLKGLRLGGLVSLRMLQANQLVRWPISTYVINKAGTLGVKTSTDNASAAEMPHVSLPGRWYYTDRGLIYGRPDTVTTTAWISYTRRFRFVTWSTQLNLANVFNDYRVLPQPYNGTLYGETRGRYYTAEPRSWAWRNDLRF